MLKALAVVVLVALAILSYGVYLAFFKPIPPVPEIAIELAAHFNERGIKVTPTSIRYGFSDIEAAVEYNFSNRPLPISVIVCKTVESAESHYQSTRRSPNLNFPSRNGRLVLSLLYWEESDFTTEVLEAFNSFSPDP